MALAIYWWLLPGGVSEQATTRISELGADKIIERSQAKPAPAGNGDFAVRIRSGSGMRLVGTRDLVSGDQPFTIEFWFRGDELSFGEQIVCGTAYDEEGFRPGSIVNDGWQLTWQQLGLSRSYRLYLDSMHGIPSISPPGRPDHRTPGRVGRRPRWQHIALMRDHRGWRVTIDGEEHFQTTTPISSLSRHRQTGGKDLMIGSPTQLGTRTGIAGEVRAVRLSDGARYPSQFSPPDAFEVDDQTLALLDFTIGEGEELTDMSGHGHIGLVDQPEWVPLE